MKNFDTLQNREKEGHGCSGVATEGKGVSAPLN